MSYPRILTPPSYLPGCQLKDRESSWESVSSRSVGASGGSTGVLAMNGREGLDGDPNPAMLQAMMRNSYSLPSLRPVAYETCLLN